MTAPATIFQTVKYYYDEGLWTLDMVWNVVSSGGKGITEDEYYQITGFIYPAKSAETEGMA